MKMQELITKLEELIDSPDHAEVSNYSSVKSLKEAWDRQSEMIGAYICGFRLDLLSNPKLVGASISTDKAIVTIEWSNDFSLHLLHLKRKTLERVDFSDPEDWCRLKEGMQAIPALKGQFEETFKSALRNRIDSFVAIT